MAPGAGCCFSSGPIVGGQGSGGACRRGWRRGVVRAVELANFHLLGVTLEMVKFQGGAQRHFGVVGQMEHPAYAAPAAFNVAGFSDAVAHSAAFGA